MHSSAPFNFGTPDPDLQPEKSRSAELGIEHNYASGAQLLATALYNEIDDLVAYTVNGYEQIEGTSRTKGLEFSARAPLSYMFSVFGNYTYTVATDADGDGDQLIRVPEHDVILGVRGQFNSRLSGLLYINHVADRVDGFSTAESVDDYTLDNLSLDYALTVSASVYLRLENLTDQEYQTALGFGTSDRATYVGVRASY